jgi:hypothetical protein
MNALRTFVFTFICIFLLSWSTTSVAGSCGEKKETVSSVFADSLLLSEIRKAAKSGFLGATVDSFLKSAPFNRYKDLRIFIESPKLMVYYGPLFYFYIYVSEYKYISPSQDPETWKIADFRKESIATIELRYRGDLIELVSLLPETKSIFVPGTIDTILPGKPKKKNGR